MRSQWMIVSIGIDVQFCGEKINKYSCTIAIIIDILYHFPLSAMALLKSLSPFR